MSARHPGSAEHMKSGGADESSGKRQNSPFRALHEGGHALNHSFKNPMAHVMGLEGMDNASYMHPLDMGDGSGPKPEMPPKSWDKANAIKPMSQQGRAGKTSGMVIT